MLAGFGLAIPVQKSQRLKRSGGEADKTFLENFFIWHLSRQGCPGVNEIYMH